MEGTLGIIGCGNMGGAIVRGMVDSNIASTESIYLYDKDLDKAAALAKETGCLVGDLYQMVRGSDILLIAVKPQDADQLFADIAGDIVEQSIVSIMAGVRMSGITDMIGKDAAVARAMPNIGAFVGESVTGVCSNERFGRKEELFEIFKGIGKVVEVEESDMDTVTAVSGSGPAYVFFLAEAMMEGAINEGLDPQVADALVRQTIKGAGRILESSEETPGELVSKVASRGGTTEAALNVLNEKAMGAIVFKAVSAAKKRSEELAV